MNRPPPLPPSSTWKPLVERALAEDLGPGDITTTLAIAPETLGRCRIEARQALTVCGLDVAREVFHSVDRELAWEPCCRDGAPAQAGDRLVTVAGSVHGLLAGERTALNFLSRSCGIATDIKIGQTTQSEIGKMFGPPWRTGMDDGDRTWTYGHYRYSLFGSTKTEDLVIRFDADDVVSSYTFNTTDPER